MQNKKRFLSGIQPTNIPHIGNYFGAIKNWVKSQEEGKLESFYFIADLHAITIRQDPKTFREQIFSCYAMLAAAGLDPALEDTSIFVQSHVPEHSELSWLLGCYAQFGELSRMTQFKEKTEKKKEGEINVGLFSYPVLQAADILIYQADYVPVGKDQKQHLELARDIAARFNQAYGDTFKLPEPYITQTTAKIMSLSEPTKKMSKSDSNLNASVFLLDNRDLIIKKFKRAVTDSEAKVEYREGDETKAGVNNLMSIYSAVTNKSFGDIQKEFDGKGYGDFKVAVGETVADMLGSIQKKYELLKKEPEYIEKCMQKGAGSAAAAARPTLYEARDKIGFLHFMNIEKKKALKSTKIEKRERIISLIEAALRDNEKVFALWLEGADGLQRADGSSDLDIWIDVEDGSENEILDKCERLINENLNTEKPGLVYSTSADISRPMVHKSVLHVINPDAEGGIIPVSFCVQSHSRGTAGSTFYTDDLAEFPLVLFDKANVIDFLPPESMSEMELKPILEQCVSKYKRRPALLKYLRQGRFLESCHFFEEYIRNPIIIMLRLIYTPRHYGYGYTQLSEHFPKQVVSDLEELYRIESVSDIARNLDKADAMYYEAYTALKGMIKDNESDL